jgi:hypothetical protein
MPFMPKPLTALVSWNVHQFAPLNDDYPKKKLFLDLKNNGYHHYAKLDSVSFFRVLVRHGT